MPIRTYIAEMNSKHIILETYTCVKLITVNCFSTLKNVQGENQISIIFQHKALQAAPSTYQD